MRKRRSAIKLFLMISALLALFSVSYGITAVVVLIIVLLFLYAAVLSVGVMGVAMGKLSYGLLFILLIGVLPSLFLFMVVLPGLRVKPHVVLMDSHGSPSDIIQVQRYDLVFSRIAQRGFEVRGSAIALTRHGPDTLHFRERLVRSANVGLFIKTVSIQLRCGSVPMDRQRPQAREIAGVVSGTACPDTIHVRLVAMPADMFYQAKDGESLNRTQFVDTETIQWSVADDQQPITFAYLAPPAHVVRPFLPNWIWTHAGGRIVLLLLTAVILPNAMSLAMERMKKALDTG